jgi:hypothetical protein
VLSIRPPPTCSIAFLGSALKAKGAFQPLHFSSEVTTQTEELFFKIPDHCFQK